MEISKILALLTIIYDNCSQERLREVIATKNKSQKTRKWNYYAYIL
ncbi:MAG: hypothetical protein BAJALOKI3v1_10065 [Promethearchaeota archaeon]|nr:MAG: hypothetical protein BAJALOKI3v1_10065 [Candidatus Lokiarchaeota archaeon]